MKHERKGHIVKHLEVEHMSEQVWEENGGGGRVTLVTVSGLIIYVTGVVWRRGELGELRS